MNRLVALGAMALLAIGVVVCSSEESTNVGPGGAGGTGNHINTGGEGNSIISGGNTNNGGCGASCEREATGVGTNNPFDLDDHDNGGVGLDPDGALVIDEANTGIPNIIWIANTGVGTVTKVDTETRQVLGRYAIGPAGTLDPSRTSVNSNGDVFVGNRAGNALTKISAAGDNCPDQNNDGTVLTSHGLNDLLPWGQDECVLWRVDVSPAPWVRGVAAQDIQVADPIPDDPNHTKIEHHVWTGGTNSPFHAFKFNGDNGALEIVTEAPTAIYGLALDGNGQLWMSGNGGGTNFGRIDTTQCVDQQTCDAATICTTTCSSSGCSGGCENAIKERINIPESIYGITVDFKQRVWIGGTGIRRYDPSLPAAQRYAYVNNGTFIHGIAADGEGFVWGADGSSSVTRVNGDTLEYRVVSGVPSKGMAVDKEGKIWSISYYNGANVIIPGPTIDDNTIEVPAGNNPELDGDAPGNGLGFCYTYSDMTGQQRALAANDPGYYREIFEGCQQGDTTWIDLEWAVETPGDTYVVFLGRTAATEAGLESVDWITLARIPDDVSPMDLSDAFGSTQLQKFIEIEVRLYGALGDTTIISPRVLSFGLTKTCQDTPQ